MRHLFFAYIDPGTGSVVLQAVLGFIFGAIFIFRNILFKLASRIKIKPKEKDPTVEKE